MRAWIFRNRPHLERIYGAAGRPRPLTELDRSSTRDTAEETPRRLVVYELVPRPPAQDREAA